MRSCLRYSPAAVIVTTLVALLMTGCGSSSRSSFLDSGSTPNGTTLCFAEQGGAIAEIPTSYVQGVPNRWVIYFHGYGEDADTILGGNYAHVEAALVNAGYIVISMTNTVQNCYGNAQCIADVTAVAKLYKSKLSLEPKPYVLADSMGGFTMLNAISAGVIQPKAAVGWCINTDLGWAYVTGGAEGSIAADYGISREKPYLVATAGYDPMLSSAAAYASVPFSLWASYSDTRVSRTVNSDRFAQMVNGSGGSVVVNSSSGEHMDPSNFDPSAVVAFFRAH